MNGKNIECCLIVSVDISSEDGDMLIVARNKDNALHVINVLNNEEAVEIYNKLIGNDAVNK